MTRCLRALLLVWAGSLLVPAWADEALSFRLEPSQVDISADYSGTTLKVIGAMHPPGDLLLKVQGPAQDVTLSHKIKRGLFWVKGETVRVAGAPSLHFLYATAPIAALLAPAEQEKYRLRLEDVPVRIELPPQQAHAWRQTFFRLKAKQGNYRENGAALRVSENGQFIANIGLSGDLQTGTFTVEAFAVNSGKVAGRASGEFKVRVVGLEHWVWNAAHQHPWLFGSLFTLAAMLLGFVLAVFAHRLR